MELVVRLQARESISVVLPLEKKGLLREESSEAFSKGMG